MPGAGGSEEEGSRGRFPDILLESEALRIKSR